jgi:hypothetical protein
MRHVWRDANLQVIQPVVLLRFFRGAFGLGILVPDPGDSAPGFSVKNAGATEDPDTIGTQAYQLKAKQIRRIGQLFHFPTLSQDIDITRNDVEVRRADQPQSQHGTAQHCTTLHCTKTKNNDINGELAILPRNDGGQIYVRKRGCMKLK